MSVYVLPQATAFQEYQAVPALVARPLRAHIAGGHAQLVRFNTAAEQVLGFLDYYNNLLANTYPWPNRILPSVLDLNYTKLWAKNAILQYFATQIGGGHVVTKLTGYNNRIHSTNLSFITNTATYPRSSVFNDRDVKVGDIVKVRGVDTNSVSQTLWTSVKAIHGDIVAATVGAASSDVNNATNQSASTSVVKTVGENNGVVVTPNGTGYNGLASGYITETYDLLVIQASVGLDYTKAKLRVISGSGTDDQASIVPAANGSPFNVGTRGLQVTLTDDDLASSSLSASNAGDPYGALVVGHRWRVTVHQAFTAPMATSGGTYTGAVDTTYIVKVSLGGKYTDTVKPQISVTTNNGTDLSGPTTVSASATPVAIGTQGTTIQFSSTALRKGDVYYISDTAAFQGPMRILELNGSMAATLAAGTELDLSLFILQPSIQISADRIGFAPTINWAQSDTGGITVEAGITAYDPTWTLNGVPLPLPLASDGATYSGLYVEYRAWLSDLDGDVFGISDPTNLDAAISGALDPDNPLKFAVSLALTNSNGSEVKYTGVPDPTVVANWSDVLSLLAERTDVYDLVPLTKLPAVQALYAAHAITYSAPELGTWRTAWFSLTDVPEIPIVSAGSTVLNHTAATTSDGNVALCTITQDPQVVGTAYTILLCTTRNAKFVTNGVVPGDIVRTQYVTDGFGNFTYSEYVVASVDSEDQLHLLVGSPTPVNVAAQTEVWRNLTPGQETTEITKQSTAWNSSRVRAVWPDQIEVNNVAVDGTFLCSALAGLISGILPHQSMTHLQITGFSSVRRSRPKFSPLQLNTMTLSGVWVVTPEL
jgi:hypothetical protein